MSKLRVLLADDHALFRDGIASLLTAWDMQVVGQANNGKEAIQKAEELQPDLILLDIHMPDMDGLEATAVIKQRWPDIKIVMLTVSEDDEHLFRAIRSGAQGYLLKNLDANQFGELLSGLAKGEAALPRNLATKLLDEFARQAHTQPEPKAENETDHLTTREIEVLKFLADGLSNNDIAAEISVSENTVKFHVRNILSKLHLRSRTEAAIYAIRKKLIGDNETEPSSSD